MGGSSFASSHTPTCSLQVHAAGPGVLQKLGRVLKEKAVGDFERVFQGTSKTREKLGVRLSVPFAMPQCAVAKHRWCLWCSGVWTEGLNCVKQVVEELFTYWNLDQTDDELEQLEELLIVSSTTLIPSVECLSMPAPLHTLGHR